MIYELSPVYDTRQSFYGKVIVKEAYKLKELYSYGTLVGFISERKTGKALYRCLGQFSQTTKRHQKEFFKQAGLSDRELKELFKNGKLEKYL